MCEFLVQAEIIRKLAATFKVHFSTAGTDKEK